MRMLKQGLRASVLAVLSTGLSVPYAVAADVSPEARQQQRQPDTLRDAVLLALSYNPEVLARIDERRARQQEIKQANAGYLPTVDLTLGVGHESLRAPSTSDERVDLTRREASLSLRQLIFDGKATPIEVSRQRAREQVAGYEASATAENITLRVSEVYLNVLKTRDLLALAKSTLITHQRIYNDMDARSKAGVGRRADLDQIAGRLSLANANLIAAETNLDDAISNYFRVVGVIPNSAALKTPEPFTAQLPATLEDATELALRNHPTLQAATYDVSAAQAQYGLSKSLYSPTVHFELSQTFDKDIGGQEGHNEDTIAAIRLRYNLFKGGATQARKAQTASLLEEAKDIRDNTHRQVIEAMRLSWSALQAIQSQQKYLEQHARHARQTREAYQEQYNIGQRTLLDLLNTENELIDAERALVRARLDRFFAESRVRNALGQGLKALEIDAPETLRTASTE